MSPLDILHPKLILTIAYMPRLTLHIDLIQQLDRFLWEWRMLHVKYCSAAAGPDPCWDQALQE